ncbi:MAG: glycosyltransferase family 39 protein [Candidatus Eisenbacteria bacterium]|nr:glycosyltransferase family 39 protein [Candidatus Eisenbacteria bacterium]
MRRGKIAHSNRVWAWALLLLMALGLRVAGLGRQSLWIDEAYSVKYAHLGGSLTWDDYLDNLHGPLHTILLHNWCTIAGDGEAALRWPSVMASVLTLPFFWRLTRRLIGARGAWAATAAIAVSPFSIWYAQEVRNYSLFLLMACVALLAWFRSLDGPGHIGRWILHVLLLFGAFLSNLASLFIIPVQLIWLIGRRRSHWVSTLSAWAAVMLLLLPWEIRFYNYRVVPSGLLDKTKTVELAPAREETWASSWSIPFTYYAFAGGYTLGPPLEELHEDRIGALKHHMPLLIAAALLFAGLIGWGVVGRREPNRKQRLRLLAWLLIPPLGVWLISLLNLKAMNPRYALVAYPAFLVLLAAGWISMKRRGVRIAAAIAVLAIWGLCWGRVQWDEAYAKEDYRSISGWMREQLDAEVLWITIGVDDPLRIYYLRDCFNGMDLKVGTYRRLTSYPPSHWDRFWNETEELASEHRRILLFESRTWHLDPDGRGPGLLRKYCSNPETINRHGIRVLKCERGENTDD